MFDQSCHASGESTTTTTSSNNSSCSNNSSGGRDQYLRQINKISHRIAKPLIRRSPFDHTPLPHLRPPPVPSQPPPPLQLQNTLPPPPPHQHQPPVYNINKSQFRDVVQKLTGSPAHDRFSSPPPIQPPKPQTSRLQRNRPPPLAAVGNRPPTAALLNAARPAPPSDPAGRNPNIPPSAAAGNLPAGHRQVAPLSPLPPFPSVHGAMESPISAYMRYLQAPIAAADSDLKQPSRLISPRWNNPAPPSQHQVPPPPSMAPYQFPMPTSPLPFGCLPSPYPLLSPTMMFPTSPGLSVPSPRWTDL